MTKILTLLLLLCKTCLPSNTSGGSQQYSSETVYVTNVPNIALISTKIVSANKARLGMIIYNNSTNSIYLCAASPCSSASSLFAIVPTYASYPLTAVQYTGEIYGIRNAGSGNVVVTEFIQ